MRVIRYLVGAKKMVWKYGEKEDGDEMVWVDVCVDFDPRADGRGHRRAEE